MIGKVVKPGKGFRGLIHYLLDGDRDNPNPETRASWHETRNLLVDDVRQVPPIMRATASRSKRVQSPVYHYVISWHHNEAPTDDFMKQVADVTCTDLGLDDYQRLYIAHDDTAHRHVHIVVCRVHPETGVAWKASHDYARIEQSLKRQAENMGLDFVPGRHNSPELFRDRSRRPTSPEVRRAAGRGEGEPLGRYSQDQVAANKPELCAIVDKAHSWDALRRAVSAHGFTLARKGQGLVFSDGGATLKLSQLGKAYRMALLEDRFMEPLKEYEERAEPLPTLNVPQPKSESRPRASPAPGLPVPPRTAARQQQSHHPEPEPVVQLGLGPDQVPSDRAQLYDDLKAAHDVTGLAIAFFNAGLVTREQLDATLRNQAHAQAEVDKTKPLMDQLLLPTAPERSARKIPTRSQGNKSRRDERPR